MRFFASFALLLLAGCSSIPPTSDARFEAYEAERAAYQRCALTATDEINSGRHNYQPRDVAVAARVRCSGQRAILHEAVLANHYAETVPAIMQVYDDGFLEMSIARTVKTR